MNDRVLVVVDDGQSIARALLRELSTRVVVPQAHVVVLRDDAPAARLQAPVAERAVAVVRPPDRTQLVRAGIPGPAGAKGDDGASAALSLPIGEVIHGFSVVRSVNGVVYGVDTSNPDHASQVVGVSLQSVTVVGQPVTIRPLGVISEANWNWPPGPIFCGPTGTLTQTPDATGWLLQVARVVSPTQIDVTIQPPIYRS